jgi:hypothetical protein
MTEKSARDAMYRVINALRYSLASYLCFAQPRDDIPGSPAVLAVALVAQRHHRHAGRVAKQLVRRFGHVESRTFPRAFTALNDLSVDYLLPLIVEDQRQIVSLIDAAALALKPDTEWHDLVVDIGDSEKDTLTFLHRASGDRRASGVAPLVRTGRRKSACLIPGDRLPFRFSPMRNDAMRKPVRVKSVRHRWMSD